MKKEKIYPVMSVTRSFSQKLNRGKFETSDFFSSRNYSWFYEPTQKEVDMKSIQLFEECYADVQAVIRIEKERLTPEGEKVIVRDKSGNDIPQKFSGKYNPSRRWNCCCLPLKAEYCEKHGMEKNNREFESSAEGQMFKEEIEQESAERKEKDAEALREFLQ